MAKQTPEKPVVKRQRTSVPEPRREFEPPLGSYDEVRLRWSKGPITSTDHLINGVRNIPSSSFFFLFLLAFTLANENRLSSNQSLVSLRQAISAGENLSGDQNITRDVAKARRFCLNLPWVAGFNSFFRELVDLRSFFIHYF